MAKDSHYSQKFYLNLNTLEGVIFKIIFEGIQSNNEKIKIKNKFINSISRPEIETGALLTKYVEGSN